MINIYDNTYIFLNKKTRDINKDELEILIDKLFPIFYGGNEDFIMKELYKKEYENLDLFLFIDKEHNNNSLLITSVYINLTKVSIYLLGYIKEISMNSSYFLEYINLQNSKGYNALLYSALRGNIEIFDKLMNYGADINLSESSGLNCLHLAVKENNPSIITYIVEKYNFNINSLDKNGNSALHWAVLMNWSEIVDFLIYYNININIKNQDGETALDLAENQGNQILIYKLSNDIYNNFENYNNSISNYNDINSLYKIINNSENFNNNFKNIKCIFLNNIYIYFYLSLYFLEILNQIIILKGHKNILMSLIFFLLFFILIFLYHGLNKSDPGCLYSKKENTLLELVEEGENLKNFCPFCRIKTTNYTHHCYICNKCIDHFEFHNYFVNNCIGKNNFKLFIKFSIYIIFTNIVKIIISFFSLFNLKSLVIKNLKLYLLVIFLTSFISILLTGYLLTKKRKIFTNKNKLFFYSNEEIKINSNYN